MLVEVQNFEKEEALEGCPSRSLSGVVLESQTGSPSSPAQLSLLSGRQARALLQQFSALQALAPSLLSQT